MGTAVDGGSALLDMSKPIDVPLLDNTVQAFYGAGSNEEVGVKHQPKGKWQPVQRSLLCMS